MNFNLTVIIIQINAKLGQVLIWLVSVRELDLSRGVPLGGKKATSGKSVRPTS